MVKESVNSTGIKNPVVVNKEIRNMVGRIGSFYKKGGVFLLLPFLLYGSGAISLNLTATDNINLLNIREPGLTFSIMPLYDLESDIKLHYNGVFSLVNLIPKNLIIENYLGTDKTFYLKGIGNKNTISANLYHFYTPYIDIYQLLEFGLSDSLNIYLKDRYLLSPDFNLRYRYFLSDSINDYGEISFGAGIRIPLPYLFFAPYGAIGIRHYNDVDFFLYTLILDFTLPLTDNYGINTIFKYDYITEPADISILNPNYMDDPFFENENLHQSQKIEFILHRLFRDLRLSISFQIYRKDFFPVYNQIRDDNGFAININFTRFIERKIFFSAGFESLSNFSSVNDFDYMKNSVMSGIRLTF
ncbi:MAG: hypothetical protein ACPL28_10290 [bacterium]